MRARAVVVVAFLGASACAFDGSNQLASSDSGTNPDGDQDAAEDTPDGDPGCQNFASLFNACAIDPTSGELALTETGTYTFDTDNGVLMDPSGTPIDTQSAIVSALNGSIRVLMTDSFVLGTASALRADGEYPIAIGAFGTLSIEGVLDVGRGGAGARSDCQASSGSSGGDLNGGAGGGGGGGFQGAGGTGGLGNGDGANQGARGPGGLAASAVPTSPLGGCPGGGGGDGEDDGGDGGVGGGAIYLSSGTQVVVSGGLQAGGSGARGGRENGGGFADAGGGGGGSGGYIFLEAPTVLVSGAVAANGGGGGEGSGDGDPGTDGQPGSLNAIPALGGAGSSPTGSDGGSGSAGSVLDGTSVNKPENGGAGGGGGGAGFVLVEASNSMLSGSISPPAI